jgi:hypothetical protein
LNCDPRYIYPGGIRSHDPKLGKAKTRPLDHALRLRFYLIVFVVGPEPRLHGGRVDAEGLEDDAEEPGADFVNQRRQKFTDKT